MKVTALCLVGAVLAALLKMGCVFLFGVLCTLLYNSCGFDRIFIAMITQICQRFFSRHAVWVVRCQNRLVQRFCTRTTQCVERCNRQSAGTMQCNFYLIACKWRSTKLLHLFFHICFSQRRLLCCLYDISAHGDLHRAATHFHCCGLLRL